MIQFGSVCSGIEAASVAWHPLGWRAAWLAEIEAFPSAVLAHHYPDVPNLGDMTRLVRRILSGEIAAPDVFTGGTPCQAFSVAGNRGSLDDARGNLTLTFCEIANAIDHVRAAAGRAPAVVMWENVPGVLSTRDNAFGCFLGALAGSGCELLPPGFDPDSGKPASWSNAGCVYGPQRAVAWRVLDAQYFGLAQRRRRVFVVASARNGFDPAAVLFESDGLRRDSAPRREAREGTAAGPARRADVGDAGHIPELARCVTTGEAKRQDWETCTIIPAPTSDVVGCLTSAGGRAVPGNTVQDAAAHQLIPMTAHTLRAEGFDAGEDGTGRGTPLVPVAYAMNQITSPGNRSNPQPGDPAPTLGTFGEVPAIAFSCKDSGADAGELAPTLRAMGHAGSHPNAGGQVAVAFTQNSRSEVRHIGGDGSIVGALAAEAGAQQQNYVAQAMAVRRLTPRECERLQGFPDDYTLIPWRGKPADACRDGPRYKALGNSWAVPCAAWIGARIARELA